MWLAPVGHQSHPFRSVNRILAKLYQMFLFSEWLLLVFNTLMFVSK